MCAPKSFRQAQSPSDKLRTALVEARGVVPGFFAVRSAQGTCVGIITGAHSGPDDLSG
jgi:hypothetical protein